MIRLEIRNNFFMERMIKHWKWLPGGKKKSESLEEEIKRGLDMAVRDKI